MRIGTTELTADGLYFVAEAGINHNGDVDVAAELVEMAAQAGADAIKFQTLDADELVAGDDPAYEEIRSYELSEADHRKLKETAEHNGVDFLSTPFDCESADLLADLGVPAFKVGSGEIDNHPFLRHVASFGRPLIVSTGMSTRQEIADANEVIRDVDPDADVIFLQCTSAYPASMDDVNLRAMETIRETTGTLVGISDHTLEPHTPSFAVAAGAVVVEKHFTLDRDMEGPDHHMSLEPDELRRSVSLATDARRARGSAEKRRVAAEADNVEAFRKSLHAARDLTAGTVLGEVDVSVLRPATGLSPSFLDDVVGTRLTDDVSEGEPIIPDVLSQSPR
ncbi:MAG: N-acetylneuraminate synthase family protein [Haloferacaceae archaeon]